MASGRPRKSTKTARYTDGVCCTQSQRNFTVPLDLVCPHCGGPRKRISPITDPEVIRRTLTRMKLPFEFPSVAPPESAIPI